MNIQSKTVCACGMGCRVASFSYLFRLQPALAAALASKALGLVAVLLSLCALTLPASAGTGATNCIAPPTGIVAWWPGESNTVDAVTGNSGVASGGITFTNGRVGQAFSFNGSTTSLRVPASSNLNVGLKGGLTIEGWIKPAAVSSEQPLVEWNNGQGFIGTHFWIAVATMGGGVGSLWGNLIEPTGTVHPISSRTNLVVGDRFQHVALTYEKASGLAAIYLDGALVAQTNIGTFTPYTSSDLYFGLRPSGPFAGERYRGLIDEMSIYDHALSSNEIAALYNADGAGKCQVAPFIIAQPTNLTVAAGSSATFSVTAGGNPNLRYQWFCNGTNLAGANAASLTLANVQVANAGLYSVLVSNAFGSTLSSNALLSVTAPPVCTPAPDGLVGWWRAESNGVDAVSGNTGILSNNVAFGGGRVGQAFVFAGGTEYVHVPNALVLNPTNGLTLEAWVLVSQYPSNDGVTVAGKDWPWSQRQYLIALNAVSNRWSFRPHVGVASGTRYFDGVVSVQTNTWYHVAMTYDNTQLKLYVNGALDSSLLVGGPVIPTTNPFLIGGQGTGPWTLQGRVDEVSLYNRALSAMEIQALYTADGQGKCQVPPFITAQPASQTIGAGSNATFSVTAGGTPNLRYQWLCNGTNLAGATAASLTLTNVQALNAGGYSVLVANGFGSVTSAVATLTVSPASYDLSRDYVLSANPNGPWSYGALSNFTGALTLLPYSRTFYSDNGVLIGEKSLSYLVPPTVNQVQGPGTAISASGTFTAPAGTVYFTPGGDGSVFNYGVIRFTVPSGKAGQYLVQTVGRPLFDGANSADCDFHVLLNGQELFGQFLNPSQGTGYTNTLPLAAGDRVDFVIGRGADNLYPRSGLKIAATLTPVSGETVPVCASAPAGIVSWWRAESNALDSVDSNNGTQLNGTTFAPGQVDQAFRFDGVSNAVRIPASASLNVGLGKGLTLETWVKPADVASGGPLVEWSRDTGGAPYGTHFWVGHPSGSPGLFYANLADTNGGSHVISTDPGLVQTNVFQHLALSYDKDSGVARLYLNGVVVKESNLGSFTPQTSYNLYLGRRPVGDINSRLYKGLMDEVAIYNRALSASEIQALYNADGQGKCCVAPFIAAQPVSQTVVAGANVTFSVEAAGTPNLCYQWRCNGTNLAGATGAALSLNNVQPASAGLYSVLVSNAFGFTVSSNASLTIGFGVPVITSFSPAVAVPGSSVAISGLNFSPTPTNNIVYFGAVRAPVVSASSSSLTVTVPVGATYAPITVTVGGLTACANNAFTPTFPGAGSAIGTNTFGPRMDLAGVTGAVKTIIADLDGDGKPDLVVANGGASTLTLFRNISTNAALSFNSFAPKVVIPALGSGPGDPYYLLVADLDGDGKLDLVTPDGAGNRVVVYRNQSSPGILNSNSFAAPVAFPVGGRPMGLAARDLDGDGRPEIIAANYNDGTLSILRNQSSPDALTASSFAPQVVLPVGLLPFEPVAGDLDGDGKPDLAVFNGNSSTISIYRNTGSGPVTTNSFAARLDLPALSSGNALAMMDVDGDGRLDLLGGSYLGSTMSVYRNLATPGSLTSSSFAPKVDFALGGRSHTFAFGDLNGDCRPDIAMATEISSYLSVFQNQASPGSFTSASLGARVDFSAGYNAWGVAIGDLDGDGRPDAVFGNFYDNSLSLYRNISPMTTAEAPVYDPAASFSLGANPNGPWSYGFSASLGSAMTLYTDKGIDSYSLSYWRSNVDWNVPSVSYNGTDVVQGPSTLRFNPHQLAFHPGPGGRFSIIRFTVPESGAYQVQATFTGMDTAGTTTDVHILNNSAALFNGRVSGFQATTGTNLTVALNRGDLLDFVVGDGGNGYLSDSTGIDVKVTPLAGNPPASCTPAPDGLVGWWRGESNGVDAVGGNTGILSNNVAFGSGRVGQAFVFAGGTEYVHVPNAPVLNPTNGLTLEAWVLVNQYPSNDGVTVAGKDWPWSQRQYLIALNAVSNRWSFRPHVGVAGGTRYFDGAVSVQTNTWYHVAMTYDNTQLKLYVNGALDSSLQVGGPIIPTTDPFLIGGQGTGPWTLQGRVDEVSLYNRALTVTEIQSLYNADGLGKCTGSLKPYIFTQPASQSVFAGANVTLSVAAGGTPTIGYQWRKDGTNLVGQTNATLSLFNVKTGNAGQYSVLVSNPVGSTLSSNALLTVSLAPCTPTPDGLVGWWRGESNALDTVGNNHGTVVGSVAYEAARVGQGFVFHGSGEGILVSNVPSLQLQDLTIEAWVKRADTTTSSYGSGSSGLIFGYGLNGYMFFMNGAGTLDFSKMGQSAYAAGQSITDTNFHHVAVTKSGATVVFYVDGVASAPVNYPYTFSFTTPVGIGYRADVQDNTFLGTIDEVSVYNRALSSNEVAALYTSGATGKCTSPNAPVILSQPASQTVYAGTNVSLSVGAAGSPVIAYQWYKDGAALLAQTNATLSLLNVQTNDSGSYSVLVTNALGRVPSSNAVLTVVGLPPTITAQPLNVTVPAGLTATFRVTASGSAPLSYQWRKDGLALSGMTNATCAMTNVQATDAGAYSVVVSNPYGAVTSTNAQLKVLVGGKNVLISGNYYMNSTVQNYLYTLGHTSTNVPPPLLSTTNLSNFSAIWLSLGSSATSLANRTADLLNFVNNGGILLVEVTTATAISNYPYAAGLGFTLTNSYTAPVRIVDAANPVNAGLTDAGLSGWNPSVRGFFTNVNGFNGLTDAGMSNRWVTVEKSVGKGHIIYTAQDISYHLQYGAGATGPSSPKGLFLDNVLRLPAATNPPSIIAQPQNQVAYAGQSAALSVATLGTPPLSYQWRVATGASVADTNALAWSDLPGATNATLVLSNLQLTNAGTYSVLVTNLAGSVLSSNAVLTVNPPPPCVPMSDSLVGWWRGENNAADFAGGNNGTLSSGVSYAAAKVGQGFAFAPGNNGVRIPASASLNVGTATGLSIECWINPTTVSTFGPLAEWNNALGAWGVHFHIDPNYAGPGSLYANLVTSSGTWQQIYSPGNTLKTNVFQHVALTYDKASGITRLYYNGVVVAEKNFGTFVPQTTYDLYLGKRPSGGQILTYTGLIDEMAIYNRALGSNEIAAIYSASISGKCPNHAPVLVCTNAVVPAGSNCLAMASVDAGSFDPDGDAITLTQTPAGPYPLGTNLVTFTATDPSGASRSTNALVIVQDQTAPLFRLPVQLANLVVSNDLNQCGAVVNFPLPVATDVCSGVTNFTCTPAPGSFFPIGTTTVECTAADAAGNVGTASFTVTVRDTQAPSITCPGDIVVTNAHTALSTVVSFPLPRVADNCPGVGQPVCVPPSGSAFEAGIHTVLCTVSDAAGNTSQCQFTVTVYPGNRPPVPVLEVSPLAQFPGWTNLIAIAAQNNRATLTFDGSKSYDPDDANFFSFWYEGTNCFSTNLTVRMVAPTGTHQMVLWLDDTYPQGTNFATATVEVISPSESVGLVLWLLNHSQLTAKQQQPFIAALKTVVWSLDSGNTRVAISQLQIFQKRVRAQLAPFDPVLAENLLKATQTIIDALGGK